MSSLPGDRKTLPKGRFYEGEIMVLSIESERASEVLCDSVTLEGTDKMLEPSAQRRILETGMSSAGDVKGICKRAEMNLQTAVGPAAGCWSMERYHAHIHPLGWSEAVLCKQNRPAFTFLSQSCRLPSVVGCDLEVLINPFSP